MTTTLAAAPTVPTVSSTQAIVLLGTIIGGVILAGGIVILARKFVTAGAGETGASVIRSWIAISLVYGLLVFCAAAFLVSDSSLRSTLFGGLIASVGAAVAFYFSSKTADQARTDILNAAVAMSRGSTKPTHFTDKTPPNAVVGTSYSYVFVADGHPAPAYQVVGGALPDGLKLAANGALRGKPTKDGSFTFSVLAQNTAGVLPSGDVEMTVAAAKA